MQLFGHMGRLYTNVSPMAQHYIASGFVYARNMQEVQFLEGARIKTDSTAFESSGCDQISNRPSNFPFTLSFEFELASDHSNPVCEALAREMETSIWDDMEDDESSESGRLLQRLSRRVFRAEVPSYENI